MKRTIFFILFLSLAYSGLAQKQKFQVACIAFYNVENLFDTIDSPDTDDAEFLPNAANKWNAERYAHKLRNMAQAIRQIGTTDKQLGVAASLGPVLLGVSEIENRGVLEDLIRTPPLNEVGYDIVHYDSPDARGVDVGLLYQKSRFKVLSSRSVRLHIEGMPNFRTRDQLLVSGMLDGELVHVMVMHWPSRRGGEKRSSPLREGAAALCRSLVDSLQRADINAKIVLMGDFNDDPTNSSMLHILRALPELDSKGRSELAQQGDTLVLDLEKGRTKKSDLLNTMYKHYTDGIGSLAWDDSWNLFDQIIVSEPLTEREYSSYRYFKSRIFNEDFLKQKEGRYKGYPWRTFSGGAFSGGYSDHFPTYIYLVRTAR
jgi:hypothetical protein